jgi:uncharacterized damage-inducible protein DinB
VYDTPLTIVQMLDRLEEAPVRLVELSRGLRPEQLVAPPAPGEWSARDVLAHLKACSDMWGKYIERILSEDHPTFKGVNPRTWIKETDYLEQEYAALLRAFTTQREDLLALLKPLPPAEWERTATVTGAGKPRQRSVYTYGEWLANHERSHLSQVERIVPALRSSA